MDISCQSCGKDKASVEQKQSKLIPGMTFNACTECISKRYEPRYLVILATKTPHADQKLIKDVIKGRKYYGDVIPAADVM